MPQSVAILGLRLGTPYVTLCSCSYVFDETFSTISLRSVHRLYLGGFECWFLIQVLSKLLSESTAVHV